MFVRTGLAVRSRGRPCLSITFYKLHVLKSITVRFMRTHMNEKIPTGNNLQPLNTCSYTGYPPWIPVRACVHEIANTICLNHH